MASLVMTFLARRFAILTMVCTFFLKKDAVLVLNMATIRAKSAPWTAGRAIDRYRKLS